MFQKIIVIGSPGSGKSTFCREIRDITNLPLHHLDMIWHKPDKTNISPEEFDEKLKDILSTDIWIIDGNYQRTLEVRLKHCDTVFLLDYPLDVCLCGAESRIGVKREDLPWIETEFDEDFKQCIVDFQLTKLPVIYKMIENCKDKKIIIFKSRQEADEYLKKIKSNWMKEEK